jgi:molybdopterin-guanine dinucleotide biosynthesis protein A
MSRLTLPAKFCSGFVLAGGRSSRMGQDKALMAVNGRALVEIVARNVLRGLDSVTLVGSRAKYSALGLPVIEDIHPGLGPLSGIHAALKHSRKPLCMIVGCDMPFLSVEFIEYLAKIAVVADADVTVAESSEYGYESLCAVYNKTALPHVEEAIAQRELKIAALYGRVKVRTLSAEECRPFNSHGVLFSNVNTAEDFTQARRRLEALAHRA